MSSEAKTDLKTSDATMVGSTTPPRSSTQSPTTANLTPVRYRIAQQRVEDPVSSPVSPWKPVNIKLIEKRCPRCNLNVYKAEEIVIGDKSWHRICFRCSQCNRSLRQDTAKNEKGSPYCDTCYRYLSV